jgi:hypothetical protein
MAAAAGVSAGNVAKAKQLTMTGRPELLEAVRSGEISIHRAWLWSKDPSGKQLAQLRGCREDRAGNKIKRLISRHKPKSDTAAVDPSEVINRLARLDSRQLAALSVAVVKGSAKTIFLTEDLLRSLPPYQLTPYGDSFATDLAARAVSGRTRLEQALCAC